MSEECENCRFWKLPYKSGHGECRRHAPNAYRLPENDPHQLLRHIAFAANAIAKVDQSDLMDDWSRASFTLWPETELDDWCGEFQPK